MASHFLVPNPLLLICSSPLLLPNPNLKLNLSGSSYPEGRPTKQLPLLKLLKPGF